MSLADNDLTYCVIGCSRWVYNDLGPGLLESTYSGAFVEACRSKGLSTEREVSVPVYFNGVVVSIYRLDLVVEHRLVVELKSCKALVPAHIKQVFHYLRVTDFELALLFNLGPTLDVKRFTLRNSLKYRRAG